MKKILFLFVFLILTTIQGYTQNGDIPQYIPINKHTFVDKKQGVYLTSDNSLSYFGGEKKYSEEQGLLILPLFGKMRFSYYDKYGKNGFFDKKVIILINNTSDINEIVKLSFTVENNYKIVFDEESSRLIHQYMIKNKHFYLFVKKEWGLLLGFKFTPQDYKKALHLLIKRFEEGKV